MKREPRLSVREKLEIVLEAAQSTVKGTARARGVSPAQIRHWRKTQSRLEETVKRNPSATSISRGRPLQEPAMERRLNDWINERQAQRAAVCTQDIMKQALVIDPRFRGGEAKALRAWVYPFLRRRRQHGGQGVQSNQNEEHREHSGASEEADRSENDVEDDPMDTMDISQLAEAVTNQEGDGERVEIVASSDVATLVTESAYGSSGPEQVALESTQSPVIPSTEATPIDAVKWRDGIEREYLDKSGDLPLFRPAACSISEFALEGLEQAIKRVLRTGHVHLSGLADEAERRMMMDEVLQTVVEQCDQGSRARLRRDSRFRNESLNAIGRTDRLVTKRGNKVIVMQATDFDKGLTQMTFATRAVLLEQCQDTPDARGPVYGVVSNFSCWIFLELTTDTARFYETSIAPHDLRNGLGQVSGALLSFLQELPTEGAPEV